MAGLHTCFSNTTPPPLAIGVPDLVRTILGRMATLTEASEICIGGGFVRGLYMQKNMGLSPKMKDIDLFANIPASRIGTLKPILEEKFGTIIRSHIGHFENEATARGLIEFAIPADMRAYCAGAESIQLNFGENHPWAHPFAYVSQANVGMNQGAIDKNGTVWTSAAFLNDMSHKTMTMNPNRDWSINDWTRTMRSLERMQIERPEFQGWRIIQVPKPEHKYVGNFWSCAPTPADAPQSPGYTQTP